MHETESELFELQAVLDQTYRNAGAHLLTVHTESRRLTARQVCDELQGVCVLNLATVNKRGAPVVAPVDGLFFHGEFWFGSAPDSARFRHIRANPLVSAAHTQGEELSIIVHGVANEIDTASGDFDELRGYCLAVYGPQFESWGYWGTYPYARIEAQRFYAVRLSK